MGTRTKLNIEIGTVVEVYRDKDKNQMVFVDVEVGAGVTREGIPMVPTRRDEWVVPFVGDDVEVYNQGKQNYAARIPQYPITSRQKERGGVPEERPPVPEDIIQGDICFRPQEGTEIYLRQRVDGGEIVYDMFLQASGDLHLAAEGEIVQKPGASPDIPSREYAPEDREQADFNDLQDDYGNFNTK